MTNRVRPPSTTRRRFMLQVVAAAAAAKGCGNGVPGPLDSDGDDGSSGDGSSGGETGEPTTGEPQPAVPGEPFTLGVASGDPLPDSVILWTRLAPSPAQVGGGMPPETYAVTWEVATDEAFADIVASGEADADPALGHSVHVDVQGLGPDTWYWYRFVVGEYTSPVGRTRTTPADDAAPERLRYATACCQNFTDGYYTAYAAMAQEELDLVVFLGDYIYEGGGAGDVRSHVEPEPMDLDAYRVRHALYKSDEHLRAMHARCPWVNIWDDHEVENNYVGDASQDGAPVDAWRARRAAAYQAFYEHMPVRLPPPGGPDWQIYRGLRWGDLAEFWLLDTRQYRDDQNCDDDPMNVCDGWEAFTGTVLGDEQEAWLMDGVAASAAVWKLIANQIVMSTVTFGGSLVNFDQWDGYPLARKRLLEFFDAHKDANIVVLSGDLHVGGLGDLTVDADDDESATVATEIVTTSISSNGNVPVEAIEAAVASLKRIKYFNASRRGYVSHDVGRDVYTVRCVFVATALEPSSAAGVEAEMYLDRGVPGLRPA